MISVIIPMYNEEKVIAKTLSQVALQNHSKIQIIVVDGGSTDHSCKIVKQHSNVILLHSEKGRATQMNVGAKHASGDWLLFLHADTLLPNHAFQQLETLRINSSVRAGGFRHRFSGQDWRLKFISWLNNYRFSRTHIIYGDQAMFVCRELFSSLGGFPALDILEDIFFSIELNKHTQPILLDSHVITDSRKFINMGIWHSLYRVANIQMRIRLGLPLSTNYPFFKDVR